MPTFTASQIRPAPAQAAGLSAQASFAAAQATPAPVQVATLEREPFPDVPFTAAQQVPQPRQRARPVLATWRGLPS